MSKQALINLFKSKYAKIGVIGLGYVGLPLIIRLSEEGFPVSGFDIDVEKVNKLNFGETYIKHIDAKKIKTAVKNGFKATTDLSGITNIDAILISVPTPLNVHDEPDHRYIHDTLKSIKPYLKENHLSWYN